MKKTGILITCLCLAVVCLTPDATGSSQIMPSTFIKKETWTEVQSRAVTNRDASDNDMSELLARLVLVEKGDELNQESWQRTVSRANNPKGGYGFLDNGGAKRMFALYILMTYERNARIRQLAAENDQQRLAIEQLQGENSRIRQALEQLQNDLVELRKLTRNGR